jgi:hypothetical protein
MTSNHVRPGQYTQCSGHRLICLAPVNLPTHFIVERYSHPFVGSRTANYDSEVFKSLERRSIGVPDFLVRPQPIAFDQRELPQDCRLNIPRHIGVFVGIV